jgi:hypothetical protein
LSRAQGTALTLTLVGSARGFVNGEAAGSAAVTLNHNDCILLGACAVEFARL